MSYLFIGQRFVDLDCSPENIVLVHNGVDYGPCEQIEADHFSYKLESLKRKIELSGPNPLAVYTGSLSLLNQAIGLLLGAMFQFKSRRQM